MMAVTILEALQNADYNFNSAMGSYAAIQEMAKEQLHNAVTLLEKGYDLFDEVEPLLAEHGNIDAIPEKESQ